MSVAYTRSILGDFSNGFFPDALYESIESLIDSGAISRNLEKISRDDDVIKIVFDGDLTPEEESMLNTVISSSTTSDTGEEECLCNYGQPHPCDVNAESIIEGGLAKSNLPKNKTSSVTVPMIWKFPTVQNSECKIYVYFDVKNALSGSNVRVFCSLDRLRAGSSIDDVVSRRAVVDFDVSSGFDDLKRCVITVQSDHLDMADVVYVKFGRDAENTIAGGSDDDLDGNMKILGYAFSRAL